MVLNMNVMVQSFCGVMVVWGSCIYKNGGDICKFGLEGGGCLDFMYVTTAHILCAGLVVDGRLAEFDGAIIVHSVHLCSTSNGWFCFSGNFRVAVIHSAFTR